MLLFSGNAKEPLFCTGGNQNGRSRKDRSGLTDDLLSFTVTYVGYIADFLHRTETGGMFKHIHGQLGARFFFDAWPVADLICL